MIALISLLVVLSVSLLITRVATVALTLTGLSQESAQFQARSALTGVGFTTSEAEQVVNHPVRRRIVMLLMIMGNAGIVTVMASLILTFVTTAGTTEWIYRMLWLLLGVLLLSVISRSQMVARRLSTVIAWALKRWTDLDVRDYANLFKFSDGYAVSEFKVEATDWMAEKALADLGLTEEGVLVLGIHRADGTYIGAPRGSTVIHTDDRLIVYGRAARLNELDRRSAGAEGDGAHRAAIGEQHEVLEVQAAKEEEAEAPAAP